MCNEAQTIRRQSNVRRWLRLDRRRTWYGHGKCRPALSATGTGTAWRPGRAWRPSRTWRPSRAWRPGRTWRPSRAWRPGRAWRSSRTRRPATVSGSGLAPVFPLRGELGVARGGRVICARNGSPHGVGHVAGGRRPQTTASNLVTVRRRAPAPGGAWATTR
jgi:hypothetical protein